MVSYVVKLADVERKLSAAIDKIDDLKNRGRLRNIRIRRLPEGAEGSNQALFFKP